MSSPAGQRPGSARRLRAGCGALLMLAAGNAASATRYVSDELVITMRAGQSTEHQIIRSLKAGTQVEQLETDKATGYSHVELQDGTTGWVLTRYLATRPIAKDRIRQIEQELQQLRLNTEPLAAEAKTAARLRQENETLTQELALIRHTASNALALSTENQTLKTELIRLETELQTAQQQNVVLKDRSARDWFIAGAGITLLGIGIGIISPNMRWRKKSSW